MKIATLALAGLLATGAWAQTPPQQDGAPGRREMRGPDDARFRAEREARRAEWQQRRAQRQAERENDMALLLDLKPSQRSQLHSFLASMQPRMANGGAPEEARMGPAGAPGMRGPDPRRDEQTFGARLAARQAAFDTHNREEQARLTAARAFYQALDARQRDKFDAIERVGRHHGPGHPMRMAEAGPPPHGPGTMAPPPPAPDGE